MCVGSFLIQCNYDLKLFVPTDLPPFYKSIWQQLYSKTPLNVNEVKKGILWNNRFIKRDRKSVFYKAWANKGIRKMDDLRDFQGHFLSFENFKRSFRVCCTFFDDASLLAAVPKDLKNALSASNQAATNELLEPSQTVNKVIALIAFGSKFLQTFLT